MNRRRLFGLGAGAVALAATGADTARNAVPQNLPYMPRMTGFGRTLGYAGESCAQSVMESAAHALIRSQIDAEETSHMTSMRRLSRLRSVSAAFVDAMQQGHQSTLARLYRKMEQAQ